MLSWTRFLKHQTANWAAAEVFAEVAVVAVAMALAVAVVVASAVALAGAVAGADYGSGRGWLVSSLGPGLAVWLAGSQPRLVLQPWVLVHQVRFRAVFRFRFV